MLTPEELIPTRFTMAGAILEQIYVCRFLEAGEGARTQSVYDSRGGECSLRSGITV